MTVGDGRHTHATEFGEDASNIEQMMVEEVLITRKGTMEETMSAEQGRTLGHHVGNDACQLHPQAPSEKGVLKNEREIHYPQL